MLLGSGLLSTVGHSAAIPNYLYGYQVLLGFGLGGNLVSTIVVVKLNASAEDSGRLPLIWFNLVLRKLTRNSVRPRSRVPVPHLRRQHRPSPCDHQPQLTPGR